MHLQRFIEWIYLGISVVVIYKKISLLVSSL